jgi:tetratricopeptide (TPR) repeat protein
MYHQNRTAPVQASVVIFLFLTAVSVAAQTSESFASTDITQIAVKKNSRLNEETSRKEFNLELIEKLRLALESSPDDPVIYNNLGAVQARLRNYEAAADALEKAVALKADFTLALFNLGIVYDSQGRFSEALSAVRKAAALDDKNVSIRAQMCQLYLTLKNFKEGSACYERLLEMTAPELTIRSNYGVALLQAKEYEKALFVLKGNAALFPNDPGVHNALGMLFFVEKKYRQALECFSRAVELNAGFDPARYNLALTQILTNDRAAALRQYALLKRSNPVYAAALYRFLYRDKIVYANK